MASLAERNTLAVLSLCEACGDLIQQHNSEKARPSKKLNELAENLCKAAQEAMAAISTDLSTKEADLIKTKMSQATSALPEFVGTKAQGNAYYLSLVLGLLDELFQRVRDNRKRSQLDLVENAVQKLHRHFDPRLEFAHVYEQSTRAVEVWMKYWNQ